MPPPPPPPPSRRADPKGSIAPNKEENIYIPSFIAKKPFYAGGDDDTDYLEHQRLQKQKKDSAWYDRGKKGVASTKYRKGACENCGAMGHKKKDCLERPRKIGAKYSGKNIQADDVVQEVELSWDAKRDRWNGYDAKEYRHVVEEFNQMEELRKQLKANKAEGGDDGEQEEDDDKYAEDVDMSKHQPTSTRQLRIREDTAKYLLNLDLESAKYDPKTRSMVDAGATVDKAAELFAEEGFMRSSGDAAEFERAQKYAWETQEKTGDTGQHLQANPTAGEFYRKKEKEEAEKKRAERERLLREKYGDDASTMPAALKDMAVTESERYVEYDEIGLIKGAPKTSAKSKYPEDVYINNHTSVWGSWWSNFQWGYACCHSLIKNSYCTGEEGKQAWEAAERQRTGVGLAEEVSVEQSVEEKQEEPEKTTVQKRTRDEMLGGVTEEEMEEYRRKRMATDDPMAKFLGKDELVH
ncbi:putative pre-mrna-splicing factor slu7 protein [Phaeoacremonium minimum UCRPA7]|uniref:Pre-mRNA-splicing factor SLU7 n=1 Tax=Phaeoacremonium minimum (strain UCR-PA7) TaxID=1286976 RepID=R8BR50_PHAM7|nr:putative pre-mrna-splicing factor slu7 protein [Phaeoacremonium minimum UCRPA7]EOO01827.1 putative pre-mrna-splicing factor slu7 protein [Phaeoacremonium minimum UCRPA7]